ncbi:fumarylacetoacetate hydrolase family protein [Aeromicrobium sp.]|uniref:fumarylacetoacetate hydrolase family protein n=1 Tax=Aeromicrobium sp. TaxID=1871063 RepID=UPI00198A9F58|nr:fumarylacetoacetate hydrolase family protein [Aeromicrobium sp.]MBC7629914.1 fumarylacetoacetate hydrolase family protein [Aeromicrobium sp.]
MTDFGRSTLPYCSFRSTDFEGSRVGIGIGTDVLDLTTASSVLVPELAGLFASGTLDDLLAAGPHVWRVVRAALLGAASHPTEQLEGWLVKADHVTLDLPFHVGDFVDFYASEQHAINLGRILRPGTEPLTASWKHLPVGYHGRSGTVVVSGTDIIRPSGQQRSTDGDVTVGPTLRLDLEAELGFVVGARSELGIPIGVDRFASHVFGVCVVNDWSARDLQAWEYVPLGPFLGKSFATSISGWIVPLAALEDARVPPPHRDVPVQDYLDDAAEPWGLDIGFEVWLNGTLISTPPFAGMYWTGAQMLAHMTVNGASVRPGDLFASGTVSGAGAPERGSLIELGWDGRDPIELADGTSRSYLADGDSVTISAYANLRGAEGERSWLGEVEGTVVARTRVRTTELSEPHPTVPEGRTS